MEDKKDNRRSFGLLEAAGGLAVATEVAMIAHDIHLSAENHKRSKASGPPSPAAPRMAFTEMSWQGKTVVGAVAVGGGLAAGYLINKWRNGDSSHANDVREKKQNWVAAVANPDDAQKSR